MYVRCIVITCSKGKDQPGRIPDSARGQLNREKKKFPVVLRNEFGNLVPRQPAHFHTQAESGAIPPEFRGGVHLFILNAIRDRVSPECIGSCNCVPMAFTAESPPAQGQ